MAVLGPGVAHVAPDAYTPLGEIVMGVRVVRVVRVVGVVRVVKERLSGK